MKYLIFSQQPCCCAEPRLKRWQRILWMRFIPLSRRYVCSNCGQSVLALTRITGPSPYGYHYQPRPKPRKAAAFPARRQFAARA